MRQVVDRAVAWQTATPAPPAQNYLTLAGRRY
jgi:hypothetical protein